MEMGEGEGCVVGHGGEEGSVGGGVVRGSVKWHTGVGQEGEDGCSGGI
jgi:hypothetical protein